MRFVALLCLTAAAVLAVEPVVINPDGAWCWFQDERALIRDGKIFITSIGRTGDVHVAQWNTKDGTLGIKTIRPKFQVDDHNVPGMFIRRDGRLMAFYTTHGTQTTMFHRTTVRPLDASEWEPEQSFESGARATYANPFQLSAENFRIYFFWRALHFSPTYAYTDDSGKTWSKPANYILYKPGERPYVKYASNGKDTVHFAFTDGHPDRVQYKTNLYHAFYRNGSVHTSDGKALHKLADGPVTTSEATRVFDGTGEKGEAWVWDMHLDKSGRPVIAYTSHPSPQDQRYRYAAWDGKQWRDYEIAYAGKRLYESQKYYAGGIALDPDNLNVVYISSDVDIKTGKPNASGHYEIYKGITSDSGKTWGWEPLTVNSKVDNLRPIVPASHPGRTFVLWYRGTYRSYTDYETEVVAYTDAKLPLTKRVSWD